MGSTAKISDMDAPSIADLFRALARERPIFHSEADFQHALAWQLHLLNPAAHIRLEYRAIAKGAEYTDIWVANQGRHLAIELKYPTRLLSTEIDGEIFELRNHGGQDLIRYDFVKDIARLERVVQARKNTLGYAILLTNDGGYWTTPSRINTADAAFRLHHGSSLTGTLSWGAGTGAGTMKGREQAHSLSGTYTLTWHDYSSIPGAGLAGIFRYVAVEVMG